MFKTVDKVTLLCFLVKTICTAISSMESFGISELVPRIEVTKVEIIIIKDLLEATRVEQGRITTGEQEFNFKNQVLKQ